MITAALFGFLGAIARYGCALLVETRSGNPKIATWIVNSSGSLAIGLCIGNGVAAASGLFAFLGAFTTFSTMALDGVKDWEAGRRSDAAIYLLGTLLSGILLFTVGYTLAAR